MSTVVTAAEELRVDILARDLLGSEGGGRTELLLAANPGLAARGPYVDEGTALTVPAIAAEPVVLPSVNPWD